MSETRPFVALPAARRNAFELFYRQPEAMILRFYAMDVTVGDRLRLFLGRPPAVSRCEPRWRRCSPGRPSGEFELNSPAREPTLGRQGIRAAVTVCSSSTEFGNSWPL